MTTQFSLFIFTLPPAIEFAFKQPSQNYPLVIYAVFSIVVESFLMCNFLVSAFFLFLGASFDPSCLFCICIHAHMHTYTNTHVYSAHEYYAYIH